MKKIEEGFKLLLSGKNVDEIINDLCGEGLGSGVYRDVYVLKADPDYVVKIERDPSNGDFVNVLEWRNWIENRYCKQVKDWLAPCVMINETGQVMIQRRIEFRAKSEYPKRIPAIFMDTKITNFGWIGDRFVCCDYPIFRQFTSGMRSIRWRG